MCRWFLVVAVWLFGCSLFGEVLQEDDFNDGVLDSSQWEVVTTLDNTPTNGPYAGTNVLVGASAEEIDGKLVITGRAHVNTRVGFNPTSDDLDGYGGRGLRITGSWSAEREGDICSIHTRSSGAPSGGYGATSKKVQFRIRLETEKVGILREGRFEEVICPFELAANTVYHFEVSDDGENLSFTVTEAANPAHTVTVTSTCLKRQIVNLVTFHNRETDRYTSSFDDIKIETLINPPQK